MKKSSLETKKKPPKTVSERVKKYRENPENKKLEITSLRPEEREEFSNLKGMENLSSANKLRILMKVWDKYFERFSNDILEFQSEELDEINSYFFIKYHINDKELIYFIQSNNFSYNVLSHKLDSLIDLGINKYHVSSYLNYLRRLCESKKNIDIAVDFPEIILNKKNIESFNQKLHAERNEHMQEAFLKLEYIDQEVEKALIYLIKRKQLYFDLINKYKVQDTGYKHISLKTLANTSQLESLTGNKSIIRELIPDLQQQPDYPYISFEEWKQNKFNS